MSQFDPYLNWLGIRNSGRAAHHYRLLNLDLFESDPKVINGAAVRQIAHLRTFSESEHGKYVPKIESRVAQAANVLLNAEKKAEYDRRLRAHLQKKAQAGAQQTQAAAQKTETPQETQVPPTATQGKAQAVPVAMPANNQPPSQPATVPVSAQAGAVSGLAVGASETDDGAPTKRRSQGTGILGSLIGVVLGGVASVFVAGWIINYTSLVPMIRAKIHGTEVAVATDDEELNSGTDSDKTDPFDSITTSFESDSETYVLPKPPPMVGRDKKEDPFGVSSELGKPAVAEQPVAEPKADKPTDVAKNNRANAKRKKAAFFPSKKKSPEKTVAQPEIKRTTVPTTPQPAKKFPQLEIPDEAQVVEAKKMIENAFPTFYGREVNTMRNEARLAELVASSLNEQEAASRYASISESVDIATKLGKPKVFFSALTNLSENFKVDFSERAKVGVRALSRNIDSQYDALELCEGLRKLTERGIDQQDYKLATHMSGLFVTSARDIDPSLFEAAKSIKSEVSEIAALDNRGTSAAAAIAKGDGDQAAHESLGDKLFWIDRDVKQAIEHWSKCDDKIKADLATAEQEVPDDDYDGEQIKKLADSWYKAASKTKGFKSGQMLERAGFWYREMEKFEKGLVKAYAINRGKEIKETLAESSAGVALRKPIDSSHATDLFSKFTYKDFAFQTSNRGTFTLRFYTSQISVTRSSKHVRLDYTKADGLLVAPVEQMNSELYFKFQRGGVNPVIKYQEVDIATGKVREQGMGMLKK